MFRPTGRKKRMVVGVVADLVSLGDDPPNEIGILLCVRPDEEKRRGDAVCLQDVEDARRPFRVRSVIEGERDLMFATRSLVIEGEEVRELQIRRAQMAIGFDMNPAYAIGPRFVDIHDLALADISNRIGALERLEQIFYRFVRLDFAREIDCAPDGGIFRAKPKDGKTACLSIAHRVQLVQKTGDIEEPDRVFLVVYA